MATLQKDPKAMRLAKNTFSQYCQSCHDKDGKGQTNFPNLTDQAWFWGGSEAQITQTITHGRKAIMPAWGPMLKEKGVTNVANYVKSISDNTFDEEKTRSWPSKIQASLCGLSWCKFTR
ncbi:hypothetical protein BSPWISOXPB_1024 [uncultured Gammaproteobacteria bacterium]|nr:hypothetical protein BSPWISOXPB_1024 [uncultured Gammaproteobacteria bacterium]